MDPMTILLTHGIAAGAATFGLHYGFRTYSLLWLIVGGLAAIGLIWAWIAAPEIADERTLSTLMNIVTDVVQAGSVLLGALIGWKGSKALL